MNLSRLRLSFVLLSLTASGGLAALTGCDPPPQPTANAGTDATVAVHQLVQLDGSASKTSDPTLTITRYDWSFVDLPSGQLPAGARIDFSLLSHDGDFRVAIQGVRDNG